MSKRDELLDLAEISIRNGGFDAVSFRDLAAKANIKSASVHYHFPTKADLGVAVVDRYAQAVLDALGEADDPAEMPSDRLERLIAAYEGGFQHGPCLCMVMGAVLPLLPGQVRDRVQSFYDRLMKWVETALDATEGAPEKAALIVSALQGGMVLGSARNQRDLITRIKPLLSVA